MKKENRNLFIGIVLGIVTGLVSDAIFEARYGVANWLQNNPIGGLILFVILLAIFWWAFQQLKKQ